MLHYEIESFCRSLQLRAPVVVLMTLFNKEGVNVATVDIYRFVRGREEQKENPKQKIH